MRSSKNAVYSNRLSLSAKIWMYHRVFQHVHPVPCRAAMQDSNRGTALLLISQHNRTAAVSTAASRWHKETKNQLSAPALEARDTFSSCPLEILCSLCMRRNHTCGVTGNRPHFHGLLIDTFFHLQFHSLEWSTTLFSMNFKNQLTTEVHCLAFWSIKRSVPRTS